MVIFELAEKMPTGFIEAHGSTDILKDGRALAGFIGSASTPIKLGISAYYTVLIEGGGFPDMRFVIDTDSPTDEMIKAL